MSSVQELRGALKEARVVLLNRDKAASPLADERAVWESLARVVELKINKILEEKVIT